MLWNFQHFWSCLEGDSKVVLLHTLCFSDQMLFSEPLVAWSNMVFKTNKTNYSILKCHSYTLGWEYPGFWKLQYIEIVLFYLRDNGIKLIQQRIIVWVNRWKKILRLFLYSFNYLYLFGCPEVSNNWMIIEIDQNKYIKSCFVCFKQIMHWTKSLKCTEVTRSYSTNLGNLMPKR